MNIIDACQHPALFKPWFRDEATWRAWFAFLAALFALPMSDSDLALYRRHTGRDAPPTAPHTEAWLCCGRRGGKSFIMALVAVYLATFRTYREHLQPGERATVLVIAADRKQARVILRYIAGLLREVPSLQLMVQRETAEGFDLDNGVTIEVGTASYKTTRGYSFAAVLADEIAFWATDDAADPDFAILDAVRPGLVTIPGSMLICASSPYARRGALWDAFKRYWAKADAPLFWKATTREMNPNVSQAVVDQALARDHASASAEYLAEFRADIEAFVSLEVVEACVPEGVFERPPAAGTRYEAFVDPSGGSADSMTLAVAHRTEGGCVQLDVIRERKPPFSPESVIEEFCRTLKAYGIGKVSGDRYGGEFCREPFRRYGVRYDLSAKPKSELYLDFLPALNSATTELLDHPKLVAQLVGLERRVGRSGKELIDHGPGGHDDVCNAVAGVVVGCLRPAFEPPVAACGRYTLTSTPEPPRTSRSSVFSGMDYLRSTSRWR